MTVLDIAVRVVATVVLAVAIYWAGYFSTYRNTVAWKVMNPVMAILGGAVVFLAIWRVF